MRVFLSWSGDVSHRVACVFKDWLPSVIQSIRPYVSSQDIDKGARWSTDIAKELHESTFGILCVTRGNIDAPWINFEAGALSKIIDRGSVAPFLFDIKRSEVQGPLLQFQSTVNERDDVFKLIASLNAAMPEVEKLEDVPLRKSFDVWWPELEKSLGDIAPSEDKVKPAERTGKLAHSEAILEEILELTRSQQRLLRTPEEFLPKPYLDHVFRDSQRDTARLQEALSSIHLLRRELERYVEKMQKLKDLDPSIIAEESERFLAELTIIMARAEYMMRDSERSMMRRPSLPIRRVRIEEKVKEEG